MAPELQNFHEYSQDYFVRKYKQTEEITTNKNFLESLKEYVWIFSKRFEQLFNFANSIMFAKTKNCSKHPEKMCMYSLKILRTFYAL